MKLSELSCLFHSAKSHLSPNTKVSYNLAVSNLIRICDDKEIADYRLVDLDCFKMRLQENGVMASSVNLWIRSLMSIFNFAKERELLQKHPFTMKQIIPLPKKPPIFISNEDFKKMLAVVDNDVIHDIILTAVYTGLRLGELLSLRVTDVDFEKKMLFIGMDKFTTKDKEGRCVPLHDSILNVIAKRTLNNSGLIFAKRNGHSYTPIYVSHKFKTYVRKAGLPIEVHFHSLRATFASWLAQADVPIFNIQTLLGHSSPTTTLKYARLSTNSLISSVNRIAV